MRNPLLQNFPRNIDQQQHRSASGCRLKTLLIYGMLFLSAIFLSVIPLAPLHSTPVIQVVSDSQSSEQQGKQLYEAGQFSEAIKIWQQEIATFKVTGDPARQAMTLSNLSLAYQQLGQWQQAQDTIATGIRLIQDCATTTCREESSSLLPQALDIQGRLQFAQGQAEAALTSWQQAAKIYSQTSDRTLLTRNQVNQAQALQALGLYRQARDLLTETNQALQAEPNTALKAIGLRSLGNVLRVIGDLDQSRKLLEQSLIVARTTADSTETGNTLLDLGNTARAQQDIKSALKFYQQAANSDSLNTQTEAKLNQLSLQIEQKQFNQVHKLLPQIQTYLQHLPVSRSSIYAKINFIQNLIKLNKQNPKHQTKFPIEVVQLLETAAQQAKALGDSRSESYALGTLGAFYETTQKWSASKDLTQQALFKAQAINAPEAAYRWQWQLGRLLRRQGDTKGAIAAYDTALKTLQSLRFDLTAMNPDVQFSFKESVEPVYRQYVEVLLQSGNLAQADLPPANLTRAREVIESLQLAEVNNFLREACLEAKQPIDQVIDQSQQSAAIYPIILADRLEVILKLPGQPLRHHRITIAQSNVNKVLNDLRQNLRKPHTLQRVQATSKQVYDWLIRPIEADLAKSQVKTLVFVLDGNLQTIPMAALYDGQQYLIEKYSLALTPSLQLIDPKPLKQLDLKALAAGVSDARPPQFSALPNVPGELKGVELAVTGQVLLNRQFTTKNLQDQMGAQTFPIVHLATHGQFSSNADETYLMAWDQPIKVNDLNRLLRKTDEQGTEAIELLVLSACQTATGNQRAALGIAGVAVRAGARSTIASLWNMNDASTGQLMEQFYRSIRADRNAKGRQNPKITKAEALRQAQLALLKDPKYQRPMFWAPYVLLGNWL